MFRTITPTPNLLFKLTLSKRHSTLEGYYDSTLGRRSSDSFEGRLGFINFRKCGDVVHPLHRYARKLRRMVSSSVTAKILAEAESTDILLYLRVLLNKLYYSHATGMDNDLKFLSDLSISIREPGESLNRIGSTTIGKTFSPIHLCSLRWCPCYSSTVYPLTKEKRVAVWHVLEG